MFNMCEPHSYVITFIKIIILNIGLVFGLRTLTPSMYQAPHEVLRLKVCIGYGSCRQGVPASGQEIDTNTKGDGTHGTR